MTYIASFDTLEIRNCGLYMIASASVAGYTKTLTFNNSFILYLEISTAVIVAEAVVDFKENLTYVTFGKSLLFNIKD